ncbi:MAG: peptide-methionine (S)-S-oxide reductase MsrA [Methylovulum sp.]|nr:peptide-methionine (S)-S-oxide reductase MsrA [Methylovulum sp.]
MIFSSSKQSMPRPDQALPGRDTPMPITNRHFVNGHPIAEPFPEQVQQVLLAMGCFWGAERKFWQMPGVYSTAVGYTGGYTPHPTYQEVCSGRTGHTEAVKVIYDPDKLAFVDLLQLFWESHNPTQGMRQGNDIGSQYRSGIYTTHDGQLAAANASKNHYQTKLRQAGLGAITTEIMPAGIFYYAEDYHQQYLAKEPQGYCGLGGLGIAYA